MELLNGKEISGQKREELSAEIKMLKEDGITPGLAVILVGDHPASRSYVLSKQRTCKELGMHSILTELPDTISEDELLSAIETFNRDHDVDGILVQLPLPSHISERKVIEAIAPHKDVDGFHPLNAGKLATGEPTFVPCTPLGILEMLKTKDISIRGKQVVVVGRSNIVGKPVGQLLLSEDATVTYCHSKTENLAAHTKQADILIAAAGRAKLVSKEMVKEGAIVIDVGMNKVDGKLCGDVDFEAVKEVAGMITPVPGGVGPMTITMLMNNTVLSAKRRKAFKGAV
ncbi:bifunctional methylenetetrahydrofolate dehydrogenase/methenyltetrahydrofolate cyclohydrolase FolD [Fictibacillus aquaticus]|uniref:Bifunctional protein FolD n=1 Tax=Fictibacillus aquaticus TaxID=2021314 RepID=A0A235FAX1_9BACL|nr:bifunctional methylenetetrahydrofolate dehydrogenase/methenyltetrahydrofolate cyclohydrolase FolD [Fictibacillus aquaticus]OYD58329.1 bifunctional methylenetetrahydrofolate dehydrogenase/methenyltetrahydrofolate cyclohydrolase [Fictibacillus aquaticus]